MPRIGYQDGTDRSQWYTVERLLRKYASVFGIKIYVYVLSHTDLYSPPPFVVCSSNFMSSDVFAGIIIDDHLEACALSSDTMAAQL
jgi:hypothetical protein